MFCQMIDKRPVRALCAVALALFYLWMSEEAMSQIDHEKKTASKKNRLAVSQSPYLLQHADNPVDWYEWGPEAFEKAERENKPIFLSIGYSTCHWCHVMAHESFEDEEVAALMNDVFVSIKVDREERPDIDSIYMTVCQLMTGRGGWPLTIIMTPEKKPFFAATYIPKQSRFGRAGMMELVPVIKDVWTLKPEELLESAEKITAALQDVTRQEPGEALSAGVLEEAYQQLYDTFDERHGGFSRAPKFPTPHNLLFLLRHWKRTGSQDALEMVEKTLRAMRCGGVFDHVGLGFHRYATDEEWLVPHFEKMLYDQAMLALAYTEAYQVTKDPVYEQTAREIFAYVLRDLTEPEGGFYSAEDADSEGVEGKFYLWTEEEVRSVLTSDEADWVVRHFNLKEEGNFRDEATQEKTGANIFHLEKPFAGIAEAEGASQDELESTWAAARKKLFDHREKRIHPHKDDKILTDWNGLMMAAFARGASVFEDDRYREAAVHCARFLQEKLRTPEGRLLHRYREGKAGIMAHLDDYAFLIYGLLNLYEATFDAAHLRWALALNREMIDRFWDEREGGFFLTADDAEALLIRRKEIDDGAIPSGNSIATLNLLRLGRLTGQADLEEKAARISAVFSQSVKRYPSAFTQFLTAIDFGESPSREVVLAGRTGDEDTRALIRALWGRYLPNVTVLLKPTEDEEPEIAKIAAFIRDYSALDGKAAAYVCKDFQCEQPTTDPARMMELLGEN